VYDWDWTAAERELKLARELSPNDSLILYMCGKQLLIVGSWNDALKLVNTLLEADPLNPLGYELLQDVQVRRGRLAEAEAAIRRSLEISPTYSFGHYSVGIVLLARSDPEAALAEFSKEPIDGGPIAGSALAYFALGRKADSTAALGQWLKGRGNDFPYLLRRSMPFAASRTRLLSGSIAPMSRRTHFCIASKCHRSSTSSTAIRAGVRF